MRNFKKRYNGFIFYLKPTEKFDEHYISLKKSFSSNVPKIYFDTCVFGRAIDGNIKEEFSESLQRIMANKDKIQPYTSNKTRKEIDNVSSASIKNYLKFIISFLDVIPEENMIEEMGASLGSAPLGSTPLGSGGSRKHPKLTQLQEIFDQDDAEQIFQAIESGADYFLTIDEKTILRRRKDFNKLNHELKIVSPKNLENILFSVSDNIE